MLSITYVSAASFSFSDADLATLLMNSRANNARLGLTGILLHREGRFMQVLEGPVEMVRSRYDLIAEDPRHRDVQRLTEDSTTTRQFPAWTMGYRALTDPIVEAIPGFHNFLDDQTELSEKPTRARRLVEWFRDNSLAPVQTP